MWDLFLGAGPGVEGSSCKQNAEKLRDNFIRVYLFIYFLPVTGKLLHAAILSGSGVVVSM